jgi:hypothetical protein
MVKIHEGVGRPDLFLEFFAANYLTGVLKQNLENLEGLNLEFDADAMFSQFTGRQTDIEVVETDGPL